MRVIDKERMTEMWVLMDNWTDFKGVIHRVPYYQVPELKIKDKMRARLYKINKLRNESHSNNKREIMCS